MHKTWVYDLSNFFKSNVTFRSYFEGDSNLVCIKIEHDLKQLFEWQISRALVVVSNLWVHKLLHNFLQIYGRSQLKTGQLVPQTINYVKKFSVPWRFLLKRCFHSAIDLEKLRIDSPWSYVYWLQMQFQQKSLVLKTINWELLLFFSLNWTKVSEPKQNISEMFLKHVDLLLSSACLMTHGDLSYRRGRFFFCKKFKS